MSTGDMIVAAWFFTAFACLIYVVYFRNPDEGGE